jgi:hypothetical protein
MTPRVKQLTGSKNKTFNLYPRETVAPRTGWSDGSYDSFEGLNYRTGARFNFVLGDNFSAQTVNQALPEGTIMIQTGTFCGKPSWPGIYCRPDEIEAVHAFLGIPFEHMQHAAV